MIHFDKGFAAALDRTWENGASRRSHSHSMVAGGFVLMS